MDIKKDMSRAEVEYVTKCRVKEEKAWELCINYRKANYPKEYKDNCFYCAGNRCYFQDMKGNKK